LLLHLQKSQTRAQQQPEQEEEEEEEEDEEIATQLHHKVLCDFR
jgi:hypothetical protein